MFRTEVAARSASATTSNVLELPVNVVDLAIEVPGRRLFENLTLRVPPGRSVALLGPSGSGKTSLLNALAGLLPVAAGRLEVVGADLRSMSAEERAQFRLRNIGLVFQFGELLPELRVGENVALPMRLAGASPRAATERAHSLLEMVGLGSRQSTRVQSLSGGERQRAAVARALSTSPGVILADEPTGSLDRENATRVTDLMLACARETAAALVVVTHDERIAARCDAAATLTPSGLQPLTAPQAGSPQAGPRTPATKPR